MKVIMWAMKLKESKYKYVEELQKQLFPIRIAILLGFSFRDKDIFDTMYLFNDTWLFLDFN